MLAVECQPGERDLDDEHRARGMPRGVVAPRAVYQGDIRLRLGFLVERERPMRPDEPAGAERRAQGFLDKPDGRVVRAAQWLADDELAAQELERLVRPKYADFDQAIVFRPRPPASTNTLTHASTVACRPDAVNVTKGIQSRP